MIDKPPTSRRNHPAIVPKGPGAEALLLRALAARLARLVPDWSDPHRFHEEKDAMVAELMRMGDALAA